MPFLDWVNKHQAQQASRDVPYHLLKQEAVYGDNAENLLIQGDNLLALKALIPFYAGRVKCIFIDPPYNTQSAFAHYDDKLEHSQWLSMMYPRLVLLRDLLAEDGSIWVTIDDNEAHYLKALMDEVFGRKNFVSNVVWNHRKSVQNDIVMSLSHNHVLVFAKNKGSVTLNRLSVDVEKYENPDDDPRGAWYATPFDAPNIRLNLTYVITNPKTGERYLPPKGRHWRTTENEYQRLLAAGEIVFGKSGNSKPQQKRFLIQAQDKGSSIKTWWDEVGTATEATKELQKIEIDFDTPKPERLLERIVHIATNHGDIVLDSFLGSATTAAVAHKMGRRYIGIEMGDHAVTHCIPRLQKVIAGEQGGISQAVNWQGGGGFRFCTLGEAAFDEHGRIHSAVKFATLAAFVWHFETGEPGQQTFDQPLLGIHNGTACYLLYNGILGDRKPSSGNVLTHAVLQAINDIFPHAGHKIIYGETTRLGAARLAAENITFKQIPYDVKMR